MPTWCHMFNSTLNGSARVWFDDLPSKSVDSYDDFKKAFLANFLQQKKRIKDPVELHHIKQKKGKLQKTLCKDSRLRHFASIKHPQTNGLVERANKSLGEGIKAWVEERSEDLIEEIPHVLWAHRTMIKTSNGKMPFSLTYGIEAVILAEIGTPTLRTAKIDTMQNDEALEINLNLLEERREQAAIREARSKAKIEKYYNSKVRHTSFKPRDLVYRSNDASHVKDGGKLCLKWEGPYEVTEALGKGAYKLKDRNGQPLPRT
nr:reverse transcriptase domain-containing protein [Tanacetum cinerariifolium]